MTMAPRGTLSIPTQGLTRLLAPPLAFLRLGTQPHGSCTAWGAPLGIAGMGNPCSQGRATAAVQTAPPAGRGIEAPGFIKTYHLVKGHPWATATQPRSAHVGDLDRPQGAPSPWGSRAPRGCKGDAIPSLIRPRQLRGKKPCSPKSSSSACSNRHTQGCCSAKLSALCLLVLDELAI